MSWLPRISVHGWMACHDDGEAEGFSVSIVWRSWEVEIAFGRHNGQFR